MTDQAIQWVIQMQRTDDEELACVVTVTRVTGDGATQLLRPSTIRFGNEWQFCFNIAVDGKGDPTMTWGQPMVMPVKSGGE